jgi:hypothetical protein
MSREGRSATYGKIIPTGAIPRRNKREGGRGNRGSRATVKKQMFPRLQHPGSVLMPVGARGELGKPRDGKNRRSHACVIQKIY